MYRVSQRQCHRGVVIAVLLVAHLEYKGGIRNTLSPKPLPCTQSLSRDSARHLPVKAPADEDLTGRT